MNSATPSIGDDEWDNRRIQPSHFGGPMNLRPYLDGQWLKNGGAAEVCLAISFYFSQLPFIPTFPQHDPPAISAIAQNANLPKLETNEHIEEESMHQHQCEHQDAPPFFTFLPPRRFLHRAKIVQKQTAHTLKHPLIHELHLVRTPDRIRRAKAMGQAWRRRQRSESGPQERRDSGAEPEDATAFSRQASVMCNGGASLGNVSHQCSFYFLVAHVHQARPDVPHSLSA